MYKSHFPYISRIDFYCSVNLAIHRCVCSSFKIAAQQTFENPFFCSLLFLRINSRNQTDPGRAHLSRYVILLATMLRPVVAVAAVAIHRFKVQRTAVYIEVFQHRARNQAAVHPAVPKHYVSVFHLQHIFFF